METQNQMMTEAQRVAADADAVGISMPTPFGVKTMTVEMSHPYPGKLFAALAKAQGKFGEIKKTKTANVTMKSGGKYSYKYADLADIFEAVRKALSEELVAVTQSPMIVGNRAVLMTMIGHESGEWMRSYYELAFDPQMNEQEKGSIITYARKYSVSPMLGVAAEEDDDGNVATDSQNEKRGPEGDPKAHKPVTEGQLKRLFAISKERKWTKDQVNNVVQEVFKKEDADKLNMLQYDWLVDQIEKLTFPQFVESWSKAQAAKAKKTEHAKDDGPEAAAQEPGDAKA
jgi:hypothetical protein